MGSRLLIIATLGTLGTLVVPSGCGSGIDRTATTIDGSARVTVVSDHVGADRSATLAATAAAQVLVDNTFDGGLPAGSSVVIVDRIATFDPASGPADFAALAGVAATAAERAAIEAALAPTRVAWASPTDVAALIAEWMAADRSAPPGTALAQTTFVLALAAPHFDADRARVASQMWCGGMCGVGSEHTLARATNGSWAVTGHQQYWIA
jgi:hypothetical protein